MNNCNLKTKNEKRGLTKNKQAGQAVLIAVILSLVISVLILFGMSIPIADQVKNSNDYISSRQALINTETLTEEDLYRLNKGKTNPSVLSLSELKGATAVSVTDISSNIKQSIATSTYVSFTRASKAIMSSNRSIMFNYGAWLGSGGIRMDNPAQVNGNVFSIGGGSIYSPSAISGVYSTSTYSVNFPVSDDDISNWINQASSGIVINGSLNLNNTSTTTTGALKIVGSLDVKKSTMALKGPLYVTGNLVVETGGAIQLDSSYGTNSETIVVGGTIEVKTGASITGSGQTGSNVLLVTQSTAGCSNYSCTSISPAISISQSSIADTILVAPHGAVYLTNNSNTKGVLANYLYMSNGSNITYNSSLVGTSFNSSTSTFWSINSLDEI